ncbi:MAG: ThiF family adenylyltransferase [Cyclobacteriaceae bacterium]|nr:ThiF family adenylyltransferase [Cyclobacteriaceae bacterium]
MFSQEEKERYSRHFVLPNFGQEAQLKLKNSSVLVVGAGGLGAPVLQYLTAAGVGNIGIADFDVVSLSNLQRQVLFNTLTVGLNKALAAVEVLEALNPNVAFNIFTKKLTSNNALSILSDFDVIIDGTDNFPTRYLVNDACAILNKPLVYGSIHGFEGQCAVFNYKGGPNYRDIHPTPPNPNSVPNCAEGGVLGALAGIIGSMMAVEAIKIVGGLEPGLAGKLYMFDSLHYYNQKIKLGDAKPENKVTELIDYEAFCSVTKPTNSIMKSVSTTDLKKWLRDAPEKFQLVDVREDNERAMGHIGGIHIPLNEILEKKEEITADGKVIFYCSGGVRSAHAIMQLANHTNAQNFHNLENGLKFW